MPAIHHLYLKRQHMHEHTMTATQQMPLITDIKSRDSTASKDAKVVNGYVEKLQGKLAVVKRAGLVFNIQMPIV